MSKLTKWDVLDACSHTQWKPAATLALELSTTHSEHISLALTFTRLEELSDDGFIEESKQNNRILFRKTVSGIRARQEARNAELTQDIDGSFRPA